MLLLIAGLGLEDDASGAKLVYTQGLRERAAVAPSGKQCTKPHDGMPYPCLEGLLPYGRWGLSHEVAV